MIRSSSRKYRVEDVNDKDCVTTIDFEYKKTPYHIEAKGNGPLDAVKTAINKEFDLDVRVMNYSEHALGSGSHARAAAYIEMGDNRTGKYCLVQVTAPISQRQQSVHSSVD